MRILRQSLSWKHRIFLFKRRSQRSAWKWSKERHVGLKALFFALLMSGAWLYSWPTIKRVVSFYDHDPTADHFARFGQFGDSFGAVNALFSGLAFIGVIYAVLLQKEELRLQREELEKTRDEFKQQNETLSQQRFENTLFNLINMHQRIVDSISSQTGVGINEGKNAIRIFWKTVRDHYNAEKNTGAPVPEEYFDLYYDSNRPYLSVYFRTLYRCFKYIEDNESKIEDADTYSKFLRAQLSDAELFWLFYNCLYNEEGADFKHFMIKYKLLDNFDPYTLLDPLNEIRLFEESVWGRKYADLEERIRKKIEG